MKVEQGLNWKKKTKKKVFKAWVFKGMGGHYMVKLKGIKAKSKGMEAIVLMAVLWFAFGGGGFKSSWNKNQNCKIWSSLPVTENKMSS